MPRHVLLNEPIDLLNVAFENPRKISAQAHSNPGGLSKKQKKERNRGSTTADQSINTSYMVPDRVTGICEVEELRRLCPGRVWNFVSFCTSFTISLIKSNLVFKVEVNVPYEVKLVLCHVYFEFTLTDVLVK